MKGTAAVAVVLCLAGCASSPQRSTDGREGGAPSALRQYENQFTPSDYDPDPGRAMNAAPDSGSSLHTVSADPTAPLHATMVPGFRVQLVATSSIDEVNTRKTQAEEAFPGEWFYIEFDPPSYKLRAGNFQTRFDADRFARTLAARGFGDAWTVPEHVFQSPPPPPPLAKTPAAAPDSTAAPP
jgi:hypothetical protein